MGARAVVSFTTGPAGSYKSYSRCARFLLEEFLPRGRGLPEEKQPIHYSNFPIKFEPWTDVNGVARPGLIALAAELGFDEAEVRRRVRVIPAEEMERWRNNGLRGRSQKLVAHGPWDYFGEEFAAERPLAGAYISIDECHNYIPVTAAGVVQDAWSQFLGELRHRGATIEFLSQHEAKVHKCIQHETEVRFELVNNDLKRDPFFKITCYCWRQLRAKLGMNATPSYWQLEYRQIMGKWRLVDGGAMHYRVDPRLYGAYDSHAQPVAGGKAGGPGLEEAERYSWPRFLAWFVLENLSQLTVKGLYLTLFILAVVFRSQLFGIYFWFFSSVVPGQQDGEPKATDAAAVVEASPVDRTRAELEKLGVVAPAADDRDAEVLLAQARRVNELLDRVDEAEAQRILAEKMAAELLAQATAAHAVVAICGDVVVLRNGDRVRVGEAITGGEFAGRRIKGVDHERRAVRLAGGEVLRMGGVRHAGGGMQWDPVAAAATAAAQLRGSLPATGGDGRGGAAGDSRGEAVAAPVRGRDADGGLLPPGGERDAGFDSR